MGFILLFIPYQSILKKKVLLSHLFYNSVIILITPISLSDLVPMLIIEEKTLGEDFGSQVKLGVDQQ